MKTLVYHDPGYKAWEEIPNPGVNKLITHRFKLDDMIAAYDTFGNAAKEKASKVILEN